MDMNCVALWVSLMDYGMVVSNSIAFWGLGCKWAAYHRCLEGCFSRFRGALKASSNRHRAAFGPT